MRYLPHTNKIRQEMFKEIGIKNIDELFVDIPKTSLLHESLNIPKHKSEMEV